MYNLIVYGIFLSFLNLTHLTLDKETLSVQVILKLNFGKNNSWKMDFLQIFSLQDQKIDLWFTNHEPLITTLIHHFLVESKPHERIDLLITASNNVYLTKKEKKCIPIVMKSCFSEEKLIKQFGNPPFWENHPFQLTPYFWAIFSWPASLSKF